MAYKHTRLWAPRLLFLALLGTCVFFWIRSWTWYDWLHVGPFKIVIAGSTIGILNSSISHSAPLMKGGPTAPDLWTSGTADELFINEGDLVWTDGTVIGEMLITSEGTECKLSRFGSFGFEKWGTSDFELRFPVWLGVLLLVGAWALTDRVIIEKLTA